MKSFTLIIPKTLSQIENHYFCECGNRFVNKEKCPSCRNSKFFTYEDVKDYNPKLYEIKDTKYGIEIFIEYPVVCDIEIKTKKERMAILIDDEIKLNKKFRENIEFYYDEICEIVKIYLKYLRLWGERKKYFYLLRKIQDKRILYLIKAKDAELLLWQHWSTEYTREEFLNKLLKSSPKSVKRAIYKKYQKQVFKFLYDPFVDYLILNVFDDVNLQREMINFIKDKSIFINFELNTIDEFIKVLKHFEKKKVFNFLKEYVDYINLFISIISKNKITKFSKDIVETFEMNRYQKIKYEYKFYKEYHFENLIFKLPKDSYELINWAYILRNCLSSYTHMHNKKFLVFGVFRGCQLIYAVNFDMNKKIIIEAKGFTNTAVPEGDMQKIKKFFKEFV